MTAQSPVSKGVPCAWGIVLCGDWLDSLTDFIFEILFCKWSLVGHWNLWGTRAWSLSSNVCSSTPCQGPLAPPPHQDLEHWYVRSRSGTYAPCAQSWVVLWAPLKACVHSVSIPVWKQHSVKWQIKKYHGKSKDGRRKENAVFLLFEQGIQYFRFGPYKFCLLKFDKL